jgi:cytochrome c550
MKRNPLIPFALTAVVGIVLIITLSFVAINDAKEEAGGDSEQMNLPPEELFQANCSSCHGGDLQGGVGPNLTEVGSKYDPDQIADIIQNGKGQMAAQKQVQAEAREKIAAWLAEKK